MIAIVGRPNVGKSTIFNRLTKTRNALVANQPGLTRDRQYGRGMINNQPCILVDTGGLSGEEDELNLAMAKQVQYAIEESHCVMWVVDGKTGMNSSDEKIAEELRKLNKPICITVNKTENMERVSSCADFYSLGMGEPFAIAAVHGRGIKNLEEGLLNLLEQENITFNDEAEDPSSGVKIALIGRPNVGKSTLINRIVGEERVVVFDMPGTTRDSLNVPFEKKGTNYTFIDTAGVRRKSKVKEVIEKFSIIKALQAMESSNVVLLIFDAHEGITDQDNTLISHVLKSGRALIIAINKWDGLDEEKKTSIQRDIDLRLSYVKYAKIHRISALHGTGVGDLFQSINKAHQSAFRDIQTHELTQVIEQAVQAHQPPLVKGRRIKLRYAHQGGRNPPIIVIHGNQTKSVPEAYVRYLENFIRKSFRLVGTPVYIEFKNSENPYKHKRNTLTPRQIRKKQRLVKHVHKSKVTRNK